MSQLSHHNENGTDAHVLLEDSPTIGRIQTRSPSNNSLDTPQKRSLRKAAPSPLQTSTTATSPPTSVTPTRTTFARGGVEHNSSSPSAVPEPRSPKERLDDLLASEKSFYRSEDSSVDSNPEKRQPRYTRPLHDTNGGSRSVSDPVLTSASPGGTPASTRPLMASNAPAHRIEMARAAPRTSSIDSALSNLSAGQSKSSHETAHGNGSTPDIANLIQAAGSPEAVIQYLLKEKTSQATQNAQLWRLVDKQRAMILGLNKDLERALKDKERYKRKLKDAVAHPSNPSPVDSNQGVASEVGSTVSDTKPSEPTKAGNVENLVASELRDAEEEHLSPIDVALAPYPITPPVGNIQTPALSNMVEAEHKMPSPTQHAFQQFNPDAPPSGFEAGQQQRKASEAAREVPYNALLPPSRTSPPSEPPKGPPPSLPLPKATMTSQAPSFAVIEASPQPDEGLRTFPTPPRKAPPAPLNLGKQSHPSSHLRQASGTAEETDSDYDDILEVDELPAFTERGRRKTREDDERVRELSALKDAEMRSLSKKSKSSGTKSKPTTPKDGSFPATAMDPMPISPRQTVPISPPDAHMRHLSPAESNSGSLAGMLSQAATVTSPLVSPPLMSPGLPMSPRPIDRPLGSPLPRSVASPPLSPRMGGFTGAVPLSPRAPRQPIPLPPNTPLSIASPGLPKAAPPQLASPKPLHITKTPEAGSNSPDDSSSTHSQANSRNAIYKGLVSEEYPELLLPPNALPSIDLKVASSRLKPSRASILFPRNVEEDPVFTLAVFARSSGRELWRVEKDLLSLANLDETLKKSAAFTAKTPERSLFSGHAPARVDARRAALDKYLAEILDTQMDTGSAMQICKYLSTNTMEPYAEDVTPSQVESGAESPVRLGPGGRSLKSGYLTKRGKNFGGWKARYFVLDGPVFKYFESPGGPHLGAIKLQKAQIGKQSQPNENHSPSRSGEGDDPDSQYRHAFLILEPKRKDSTSLVRHVLCAESDVERDQWVEALCQWIDYVGPDEEEEDHSHDRASSVGSGHGHGSSSRKKMYAQGKNLGLADVSEDSLRGINYESTRPGNMPVLGRPKHSGTPSPPTSSHDRDPFSLTPQPKAPNHISGPKNAQVIQDSASWGNRGGNLAPAAEDKKQRKRSFFGFGTKIRASLDSNEHAGSESTSLSQMAIEQHGPIRPVFGAPLAEAVKYSHPADVHVELPAVVYRCIEYLDAKNAAGEEGIFRLSGSNVVIRQLRERFQNEGDVNLITDDQYYDIHAVASLLKLYLRELPTTILTRELHLEFLAVTELNDLNEKIGALNGLVRRLPRVNETLLRYLAGFLINIINHADTNKMTVRNVGIVFSPTLNIPAPVFALFLQQYTGIFDDDMDEQSPPIEVHVSAPPLSPEDIRSPRRQMFQELPTPSYAQQSFDQSIQAPLSFPQPMSQQQNSHRGGHDTGFTPLQPSYEPQLQQLMPTMAGPEYGRATPTLSGPAYEQFAPIQAGSTAPRPYGNENTGTSKSKRRESSMFGMSMNIGLGQRRPSHNALRPSGDSRLVDEETYFE